MSTILVTTDFSRSSRNAFAYAGSLPYTNAVELLLVHVYTIPATYAGDGVALAAVNEALTHVQNQLNDEVAWVNENYPSMRVRSKVVIGDYIDCLEDEIGRERPILTIIGAAADYSDIFLWDSDTLKALTELSVPVLIVPPQVKYKPIENIAFACNYRSVGKNTPTRQINDFVKATGAKLKVVNISADETNANEGNKALLQELLHESAPLYYTIQATKVIEAIDKFVTDEKIDCLLVVPRRHGVWDTILKRSHTKELARLNHIPIMALHDNG